MGLGLPSFGETKQTLIDEMWVEGNIHGPHLGRAGVIPFNSND